MFLGLSRRIKVIQEGSGLFWTVLDLFEYGQKGLAEVWIERKMMMKDQEQMRVKAFGGGKLVVLMTFVVDGALGPMSMPCIKEGPVTNIHHPSKGQVN